MDLWNRQVQFCLVTIFLAVVTVAFPFSFVFWIFIVINFLVGFLCTLIDCISNAWVVELFRPHEHIFIQILHFFYSFGTIISPYLFGPYLNKNTRVNETDTSNSEQPNDEPEKSFAFTNDFNISLPTSFQFIQQQISGSQIWIPFVFVGLMILSSSLVHWVAYALKVSFRLL